MDRHHGKRQILEQIVLRSKATTTQDLRAACANQPESLPGDIAEFAKQIHAAAYRISDQQVEAMAQARSEDEIFEITIAAAVGKSAKQMEHALRMMQSAKDSR